VSRIIALAAGLVIALGLILAASGWLSGASAPGPGPAPSCYTAPGPCQTLPP